MLEKTLESPLDCKEIQPVHPKDQPWMFIGRTDVEAEILWPSTFFAVQLSHPYMTTGKNIALTISQFSAEAENTKLEGCDTDREGQGSGELNGVVVQSMSFQGPNWV